MLMTSGKDKLINSSIDRYIVRIVFSTVWTVKRELVRDTRRVWDIKNVGQTVVTVIIELELSLGTWRID
jgi:hypothetical protein